MYELGLEFRFSMFLPSLVQSIAHLLCISVTLRVADD